MKSAKARRFRGLGTGACLLLSLVLSSCQQGGLVGDLPWQDCDACAAKAKVCTRPTVRALAQDLDKLERHIEKYGSVVAKQPDVWGQARLTRHREEFEQQMAAELGNFVFTLQGSVSGSDQAYLADAFALSAAAVGSPRRLTVNTTSATADTTPAAQKTAAQQPAPAATAAPALQPLPLPDQSNTFAAFTSISRTPVQTPLALGFAGAKNGIALEPTVLLDQKARYLNHLHELRRINEGDDTADSPGYSLNLVRIPVSVLPGKCTDIGCGAEVTMTLEPYLGEELLPTTFRNLVLNDLVDQLGLPLTVFLNDPVFHDYFADESAADLGELIAFGENHPMREILADTDLRDRLESLRWTLSLQKFFPRPEWVWVDKVLRASKDPELEHSQQAYKTAKTAQPPNVVEMEKIKQAIQSASPVEGAVATGSRAAAIRRVRRVVGSFAQAAEQAAATHVVAAPVTRSRRVQRPFPPSQIVDLYGQDFLYHLALDAFRAFARLKVSKPCTDSEQVFIHLPDIQGYLQEELTAAHKFLSEPTHGELWHFCTPELAAAIRARDTPFIDLQRRLFKEAVAEKTRSAGALHPEAAQHSTAAALAWARIIDAALLTDQLVQDMKESASAKGCGCAKAGWLPYFLPEPPPEARQAFNDYVRCRWPIHVFALDPAAQQQNLADTFSSRREMQLSMSLAFVSGQLSASNMLRYARRIEFDFATIDLNGTTIGFSHGNDTFGWRFYPRFQTPDIESNATVIFRDLLIGGPNRNALLRQRRLEPGMRECVAVVIMPSFVPYATLHVNSNWFKLTNPKCKKLDSADAMRLSKSVKSIQNCALNVGDADCYRDGDFDRLLNKAKQLETRLPLQSTMVQIPYENTLGGFAMFNTGVTDLAPELAGWYGSPSINPKAPTTLFLVGNHFSVHQTRVIAGGQEVVNREMLSRQVIKVVIPANPLLLGNADQKFVDIHLATPYGLTQHLLVPACMPPEATAAKPKGVVWSSPTFELAYAYGGVGITQPPTDPKFRPTTLVIQSGDVDPVKYATVEVTLKFDAAYGADPIVLSGVKYDKAQGGYVIPADVLATQIFQTFGSRFGPETTNPPAAIVVAAAGLKFTPTDGSPALSKLVGNPLTISWIKGATTAKPGQ